MIEITNYSCSQLVTSFIFTLNIRQSPEIQHLKMVLLQEVFVEVALSRILILILCYVTKVLRFWLAVFRKKGVSLCFASFG